MFHNLEAEMARAGLSKKDLASCIGKTERALNNKMSGNTSFTWDEILAIKDTFFSDLDIDYLFEKSA